MDERVGTIAKRHDSFSIQQLNSIFRLKRADRMLLFLCKPISRKCGFDLANFIVSILTLFFTVFIDVAFSEPLPDTGQSTCYDDVGNVITCPSSGQPFFGQDGNYAINPPSYTKLDENGNTLSDSASSWSMVRDNVTGMIWEVKRNMDGVQNYDDPHDADNTYAWYDSDPATNGGNTGTAEDGTDTAYFINSLNTANFGGHSDWRVPTLKDLRCIVNYDTSNPSISTEYFPNTKTDDYWSSTTYAHNTSNAGSLKFNYGYDDYYHKSGHKYVRAVRGGQSGFLGHLVINGDGTVTDIATGLMWQQTAPLNYTWPEALEYCENLSFNGYSDWRLPTIKELDSIVDPSREDPSINTNYFSDTVASRYWSSTTYSQYTFYALCFDFKDSYDRYNYKLLRFYVRAVRGGQLGSLGHLVLLSPSQASRWNTGDVMPITWDSLDLDGNVSICISRDGGKTFDPITDKTANDGSFTWTVTGAGSVNCALKITPMEDLLKATTQSLFTIDSCPDDSNKLNPGVCGCGVADTDADGDNIMDCVDNFPNDPIFPSDLDNNGHVDLTDAILAFKTIVGMIPANTHAEAEISGDKKIGVEEVVFILQKAARLR